MKKNPKLPNLKPITIMTRITDEIRNTAIEDLFLDKNRVCNALRRNGVVTVGEALDKWDSMDKMKSVGESVIIETKAGIFAYLAEKGAIDFKQEVVLALKEDKRGKGHRNNG